MKKKIEARASNWKNTVYFRIISRAFYPLESKCRRAIQNEGEFSGFYKAITDISPPAIHGKDRN